MLHYSTVGQKRTLTKISEPGTMPSMANTKPCEEENGEDLFLLVAVKTALYTFAEDPELADARAVIASLKRQGIELVVKKAHS